MILDKLEQGLKLHQAGKLDEAEAVYIKVLSANPANPDALHFLGLIFQRRGFFDKAITYIEEAIANEPDRPTFHFNLGAAHLAVGDLLKAANSYMVASQLKPDWCDAFISLGTVLGKLNNYLPAEISFRRVLELEADNYKALIGLTAVLNGLGQSVDAEFIGRRAISVSSKSPEAWLNLGNALKNQSNIPGKLGEAEGVFRHALTLDPGYVTALFNLGNVMNNQWRLPESLDYYKQAVERDPLYESAWNNLLMGLLYDPRETEQTIFSAHKKWATQYSGLGKIKVIHKDQRSNQRLRIGYVSPDFKSHSCASFLKPLFTTHNRQIFEIYAYANVVRIDKITDWFRKSSDHWRDVTKMNDEELGSRIRQDGIDILVDLAGHSADNRLAVFAMKPAPIQLAWLGYPGTTGLTQIDYRLTDAVADPEGSADFHHSEELIRLKSGFHCYMPFDEAPNIGPLPASHNGFITFASFNNIKKITPEIVETWAKILKATDGSKLLLKGGMLNYDMVRESIQKIFQDFGIVSDRLDLRCWIARDEIPLKLYNSVDICLDTFPYNGVTTSFEALSMGVPVVTLKGDRHASRVGASILTELGHTEWIADTHLSYKEIAVKLAGDITDLNKIRSNLRSNLKNSSFGRPDEFVTKVEDTYLRLYSKLEFEV
jgi:protein O-GlcNAc transferase